MMKVSIGKDTTADQALADLLEEIAKRLQAGEPADLEAYVSESGASAEQLKELLPTVQFLAEIGELGGRGTDEAVGQSGQPAAEAPAGSPRGMIGEYRILREIGRGGMGIVYEAEQLSLRRRVALKIFPFAAVLDPRRLQRFKNEAQAAAALDHPNIVHVYSVGCERGVHYYAMQYIEGQTLAELIAGLRVKGEGGRGTRDGESEDEDSESGPPPSPVPLPPSAETSPLAALSTERSTRDPEFFRTVARLGIQAAEALEHAHQLGVVHRDIKPSNLLLDARGHLWITDFGLAITQKETNLTMTGDVLGTLRYMSPEQVEAKHGLLDHRTDVYSLGLTLYELLTLQPAFPGDDRQKLIRQVIEQDPRPPRQLNNTIPKDLETVILKATAKEPEARYATAQELAEDLRRFVEDRPIEARRPSLATRAAKWSRRHRSLVWSAALLLVVASTGLAISTLAIAQGRAREKVQRERAEENLRLALDALDRVYLRFANRQAEEYLKLAREQRLERQELSEEDRQFLEDILGFYEQFVLANRGEPRVRLATVEAYSRVGDIRGRLGMQEDAEQACSKAIDLAKQLVAEFPGVAEYPYRLACAYRDRGIVYKNQYDFDKAIADFDQALSIYARDIKTRCQRASAHSRRGLQNENAAKYEEAIKDYEQAISDCNEVFGADPTCAEAYSIRGGTFLCSAGVGHLLGDRARFDKAVADLRRAIELNPKDIGAYSNCGCAYNNLRKPHEAIEVLSRGLERAKTPSAYPLRERASAYWTIGEVDKAIADYDQAIEVDPNSAATYNARGAIYGRKGEVDKAIGDFTEAIRVDPKFYIAYANRGKAYREKGDLQKALANWTEAIQAKPNGCAGYLSRAAVYEEKGDLDKAIADYTEAIRLNPRFLRAYLKRSDAYREKGELDQAIANWTEFIEARPNSAAGYSPRGAIYAQTGDFQRALADYERTVELSRPGVVPLNKLAWFLVTCPDSRFWDPDRALKLAGEAVELKSTTCTPYCWNTLGVARYRAGKWTAAIQALEESEKLFPGAIFSFNGFFLAMAHWQLGNKDRARESYEKAVKWMEDKESRRQNDELRRFRAEAAELLGLTETLPEEKEEPTETTHSTGP